MVNEDPNWKVRVVYGDTDSLFVEVPGRSRAEAFRIGAEIAQRYAHFLMRMQFVGGNKKFALSVGKSGTKVDGAPRWTLKQSEILTGCVWEVRVGAGRGLGYSSARVRLSQSNWMVNLGESFRRSPR